MAKRKQPTPFVLVDVNVVLDVLLAREPWSHDATMLLDLMAREQVRGAVASHTVTTLHFLVARTLDARAANVAIADLLDIVEIVPPDAGDFRRALSLGLPDFEDAVQVVAHLKAGASAIVTRNAKDFRRARVETRLPGEVLAQVQQRGDS